MKVSCLQENLAKGLSIVGRAVATRSTLPVLSNVMLATDGSRLKLSATNLEIGIVCWIGAKVEEDGSITVPARLLTDFVNSLPPERIDMELTVRTQTLNLKCARFEANIKGIDAQEFPLIPTAGEDSKISLDSSMLRQMIDQVVFAAATDESRPILTGVLAKFQGEQLTLAAADGFRLSVRTAHLSEPASEPVTVIVPARALAELSRISTEQEQPIEVTITPARNQALFHMANVDLVSQLIEGNFPDYNQIIPKSYSTRTVVSTSDFLKAAKTVNIFARDAANIIRLEVVPGGELAPGRVTLTATSAEVGDNVGEFDAVIEGQEMEIAFNAKYLIDILSVADAAQVALETTTASSPGVIKPVGSEDFIHVIMPMHISR
ncbi:MAG: DNA polymerase III subunit beta [Anaerolineales bacterium]|nr:MAG: DNA polymerase III subunit beta [Anaerolineales bacterium]